MLLVNIELANHCRDIADAHYRRRRPYCRRFRYYYSMPMLLDATITLRALLFADAAMR